MKDKVIGIINSSSHDSEKFNELFSIYKSLPQKNQGLEKHFNVIGYKASTFNDLVYELKKHLNITDLEVLSNKDSEKDPGCSNCKQTQKEVLVPQGDAKGTEIPADEKKTFREDYPFLTDPNCPEEFKILAADKITAYNKIEDGRKQLEDEKFSKEEKAAIAKEVATADILNSQIHDEFEHFKATNEILGLHPIFSERKLKKKIELMTGEEKARRVNALNTGIRRDKSALKNAKNEKDKIKISERMDEKKLELSLLKKSM